MGVGRAAPHSGRVQPAALLVCACPERFPVSLYAREGVIYRRAALLAVRRPIAYCSANARRASRAERKIGISGERNERAYLTAGALILVLTGDEGDLAGARRGGVAREQTERGTC